MTRFATTFQEGSVRDGLIATDSRWGEPQTWAVVKRSTQVGDPLSTSSSAVDLMQDRFGDIVSRSRNAAIFIGIFWRTIQIGSRRNRRVFPARLSLWLILLAHLPTRNGQCF